MCPIELNPVRLRLEHFEMSLDVQKLKVREVGKIGWLDSSEGATRGSYEMTLANGQCDEMQCEGVIIEF